MCVWRLPAQRPNDTIARRADGHSGAAAPPQRSAAAPQPHTHPHGAEPTPDYVILAPNSLWSAGAISREAIRVIAAPTPVPLRRVRRGSTRRSLSIGQCAAPIKRPACYLRRLLAAARRPLAGAATAPAGRRALMLHKYSINHYIAITLARAYPASINKTDCSLRRLLTYRITTMLLDMHHPVTPVD